MPLKSIRRRAEEVIKSHLQANIADLSGVQILIGREITKAEATSVRIHCSECEPEVLEGGYLGNRRVRGTITLLTQIDEQTRAQHDTLEGALEEWVEMDEPTMLAKLNDGSVYADFGAWEWEPRTQEDGVDEDLRRFRTDIGFECVLGHMTYN